MKHKSTNQNISELKPRSKKPSLGLTLLLNILVLPSLLGLDRFYTGNTKAGFAMLIGSITIIGLLVTIFITLLSTIFLIFSIFANNETVLLYGETKFDKSTTVDKIIGGISIIVLILPVFIGFV